MPWCSEVRTSLMLISEGKNYFVTNYIWIKPKYTFYNIGCIMNMIIHDISIKFTIFLKFLSIYTKILSLNTNIYIFYCILSFNICKYIINIFHNNANIINKNLFK